MARPRRQSPQITIARRYIKQHMPELEGAALRVRQLDGPPDAPRFVVTVEHCPSEHCPHGREKSPEGTCDVESCALRSSARLLIMRDGQVIQVTSSDLHWR
jgi:hypothetical protein